MRPIQQSLTEAGQHFEVLQRVPLKTTGEGSRHECMLMCKVMPTIATLMGPGWGAGACADQGPHSLAATASCTSISIYRCAE